MSECSSTDMLRCSTMSVKLYKLCINYRINFLFKKKKKRKKKALKRERNIVFRRYVYRTCLIEINSSVCVLIHCTCLNRISAAEMIDNIFSNHRTICKSK